MTVKIDGTNTEANPAFTGVDTDTGLQCGTNELKLVTGGTARATVDSSGRLLVGATSGAGKFIVQDSSLPKIQANYGGTKHMEFGVGGSGCGFVMTTGHFMTFNHQPYANRGTDNNLTERLRILSSGGITFNGDTAAANALDEYEEGAWTPDLRFGSANTGITYNSRIGKYVKIGRLVWVTCRISLSSKGSASGNAQVFGLPFDTSTESNTHLTPGSIWFSGVNIQGTIQQTTCRTDGNNQGFIEFKNLTTGAEDSFTNSDLTNTTDFAFQLTYLS